VERSLTLAVDRSLTLAVDRSLTLAANRSITLAAKSDEAVHSMIRPPLDITPSRLQPDFVPDDHALHDHRALSQW
jgi:hypothetical protein